MNALSLFSGGGIGETYLEEIGIHTAVANEFVKDRAELYQYRFPGTDMVVGDIQEKKDELIQKAKDIGVRLLIATPPCQGMSLLGSKNYKGDKRNFLIFDVIDIIHALDLDYIFIENVPNFLKMAFPKNREDFGKYMEKANEEFAQRKNKLEDVAKEDGFELISLTDLLEQEFGNEYEISYGIYNAADYGVPQRRKRAIIRIYRKGLTWADPEVSGHHITLREAIGYLPSIEALEKATERYKDDEEIMAMEGIQYHNGTSMADRHLEELKHTPSGCSAYDNEFYYPKREDGKRIRGFHSTYSRLDWDALCPTRTMKSASIGGSSNGHPGRCLVDGDEKTRLYSDARCLSLLELFIVTSLPKNMDLPKGVRESLIRDIIGEGVPPLMSKAFLSMIAQDVKDSED